jgi:5'-3' exonuclease
MYNPTKRKMLTPTSFEEEYGITPRQWVDVKTYAGCPTDGVPGITGIGQKTCIQFIKGELNPKSKKYLLLKSAWGTGGLFRKLVQLPFPNSKKLIRKKNDFSKEGFEWVAEAYGMSSFLKNPKKREWDEFFSMKFEDGFKRKKIRKPKRRRR